VIWDSIEGVEVDQDQTVNGGSTGVQDTDHGPKVRMIVGGGGFVDSVTGFNAIAETDPKGRGDFCTDNSLVEPLVVVVVVVFVVVVFVVVVFVVVVFVVVVRWGGKVGLCFCDGSLKHGC